MRRIQAIFIDDGGVLNDNARRGLQWQRLVGEYLAPRLGGDPVAWGEANKAVIERQMAEFDEMFAADSDFTAVWREAEREWLRWMCELVGVGAPEADEECSRMVSETNAYVTRRVHSDIPGAVGALRSLHDSGYILYTASGSVSSDLEGYLVAMGVRRLFRGLYGPDLVNVWKGGPLFYERVFADAGVSPSEALVVDDSVRAVEWAAEAGSATVLISAKTPGIPVSCQVLGGLAELPDWLADC